MQAQTGNTSITEHETVQWNPLVCKYLAWGRTSGGKGGAPWALRQAANVSKHLNWWHGFLNPTGAPFDLSTLKLSQVEDGIAALRALNSATGEPSYAPATIRHRVKQLRAFLNWCRKRDYLTVDPLRVLTIPGGKSSKRLRALTMQEFHRLYDTAPFARRTIYLFAVMTAFRQNEMRSLNWSDVKRDKLCVQLKAENEKTRTERWFPLTSGLIFRLPDMATEGKLFAFTHNPIHEFDKDLKRAGIEKVTAEGSIDFHGLRRTAITWFEEAGGTDAQIRAFGRHQSDDTSHRYRKVTCDGLREVMLKVENRLYECANAPAKKVEDAGIEPATFRLPESGSPNEILKSLATLVLHYLNSTPEQQAAAIDALRKEKP